MVDADFVSYFLNVMLKNYFFSKRKMAKMLGVTLRTVQIVFHKMPQQKGASLVFVNAICYCYKNRISVDAIYEQYNNEVKKHSLLIFQLISRSGLAKQIGRSAIGTTYLLCKIFHLPPLPIIS